MVCPFCSSKKTKVTNSRPRQQRSEIWRRRECTACNRVFTTYEQPTLGHFTQVINPLDDSKQPFSVGKLSISIYKSFAHDELFGETMAYWLARTIESHFLVNQSKNTTISSTTIAKATLTMLKRVDKNAAYQYAASHKLLNIL